MPEMLGVVKVVVALPPVKGEPPVLFAYQSNVAGLEAVADRLTVPVPQFEPGVAEATVGTELMVAATAVLAIEIQLVVVFLACA